MNVNMATYSIQNCYRLECGRVFLKIPQVKLIRYNLSNIFNTSIDEWLILCQKYCDHLRLS